MVVLQKWVQELSFMQQAVLMSALRGPDNCKNAAEKAMKRWFRRSILYSAFESKELGLPFRFNDPAKPGGGSFTGPTPPEFADIYEAARAYSASIDLFPHHYLMHFIGAAEIVGYKHDVIEVAAWWRGFYERMVKRMHLHPETLEEMDRRLGDDEDQWKKTEK